MSEREIVNKLRRTMGSKYILGIVVPRARRIFVDVDREKFKDVLRFLKDEGFTHLSAITGLEVEDGIEILYHLGKGGIELTVRIKLPLENPVVPTITDITLGAVLYEREVHDLLGVKFEGHPNLARLVLPDEWPEHVHPLRKHLKK
ncbi:MAG TPA: NADH-quinone oxidoreductase subunit C [Candidatus Bathyarchaeota archaeon]|nr:NADH-quinone oxidoreductase subunit C [Candidatus Bathyarchaeota archaeon]